MGPAIRVRGSGGLVPAEALTAAAGVEPDGEPSAGGGCREQRGRPRYWRKGFDRWLAVRRVKVAPPSVETDAPEMLIGLALRPRESL